MKKRKTKKINARVKEQTLEDRYISNLKCTACKRKLCGIDTPLVMGDTILCYDCMSELTKMIMDSLGMEQYLEDEVETTVSATKKVNANKKKTPSITAEKVLDTVLKDIKGQDDKVKKLISILFRNFTCNNVELKSNIIIIGKTGTGKTKTLKKICSILDKPYVIENCTGYTKAEYKGGDVPNIINHLINKAEGDLEKASNGVVILDEFDKICVAASTEKDDFLNGVQKELLKIIEGTIMHISFSDGSVREFDTSNITFIGLGSFSDMYKIREKRYSKKSIGFAPKVENEALGTKKEFTTEDLKSFGVLEDLIGRMPAIIEWNELGKDILKDIILNSESSQLKHMQKYFKSKNIEIIIGEGTIDKMAEKAVTLGTGARSIKRIIEDTFSEITDIVTYPKRSRKGVKKVFITPETVDDPSKFTTE